MPTDATGTPSTNFSFPKYNTADDAPSGVGLNAIIDDIDSKLATSSTLLGAIARLKVRKNSGADVGSRRRINFIEGSGITLTVSDDSTDEEVDVTIATSGSATIPAARVRHASNQTMTGAETNKILAFDTEDFDTDTIHDTATNNSRLTCKTAGKYQIQVMLGLDAGFSSIDELQILLNGTTVIAEEAGDTLTWRVATTYDLAVNDYVEVRITSNNSGGTRTINGNLAKSPVFEMFKGA